jgi:hypothetical protein
MQQLQQPQQQLQQQSYGSMDGLDPRAIAANPQGFQQWNQQRMQQQLQQQLQLQQQQQQQPQQQSYMSQATQMPQGGQGLTPYGGPKGQATQGIGMYAGSNQPSFGGPGNLAGMLQGLGNMGGDGRAGTGMGDMAFAEGGITSLTGKK